MPINSTIVSGTYPKKISTDISEINIDEDFDDMEPTEEGDFESDEEDDVEENIDRKTILTNALDIIHIYGKTLVSEKDFDKELKKT